MRPWLGLSPTSPHAAAGMRIEPPPSLAWATGTARAATSAAEPPDDPPGLRPVSHGLRTGPVATGSVVALNPSSGVAVTPRVASPARRKRAMRWVSAGMGTPAPSMRLPAVCATPVACRIRSLIANGTPAKGPSAAYSSGAAKRSPTSAFSCGSTASRAAVAAFWTSSAETCPSRTSAARAVASRSAYSWASMGPPG